MSSQLQVTGEAKIRDIQGPVVANSGVITALDGGASQYVRGDGTLADFPTSSGGGSSVSYYLNSSVSQGTIGGVAYRELSKDPIIGTGTDIAISTTGYVASYITDANDPDVTIVPGGNFNCEFYFSVNNNTGNPFTYAELYKYDGTTFTLLGSSVGVPEYINQGTIIAPYYFAIPVATAALAITDRLAIRIYVNVDGRTVTLHTENSHLCQVVTTLSKGMVSLNNLTDQSQYLTTGTTGTNFTIASTGDTHTFNIPVASATNTGKLSSSDWSTFNNKQVALSFTAPLVNTSNTISIPVATSIVDGYLDNLDWTNFNTAYNNMIVSAAVTGTTTKTLTLNQQDGGTITASWTDDNTDAVTSVFGRTGAVIAVSGDYNTSQVTENTNLYFTDSRARLALSFAAGSGAYNSTTGVITIPTNNNQITNGSNFITLASLSATTPLFYNNTTGDFTLQQATSIQNGYLSSADWTTFNSKQSALTNPVTGTGLGGAIPKFTTTGSTIGSSIIYDNGTQIGINTLSPTFTLDVNGTSRVSGVLTLSSTISNGTYTYTLPSATGTIALTSQIPANPVGGTGTTNYLPKFTGASTIGDSAITDNGTTVTLNSRALSGTSATFSSSVQADGSSNGFLINQNGGAAGLATYSANTDRAQFAFKYAQNYPASNNYTRVLDLVATGDATGGGAIRFLTSAANAAATEKLIITSGGNVGIATSSPQLKLDIQTGSLGVYHNTASSGGAQIYLGDMNFAGNAYATSAPGIGAAYNSSQAVAGDLAFYIYASTASSRNEAMRIKGGTGNVLIGTTTDAGYKLDVNGTGRFSGALSGTSATFSDTVAITLTASDSRIKGGDATGRLLLANSGTTTYGIFYGASHATNPNTISLVTDNTERLKITNTGAATFSSSVNANSNLTGTKVGFSTFDSAGYGVSVGYIAGSYGFISSTASISPLVLAIDGVEKVRLTTGGNVLIGTTTDNGYAKLQINGSATATTFYANDGTYQMQMGMASNNGYIQALKNSDASATNLQFLTGTTERMRITSSGNVLIGTTTSGGDIRLFVTGATGTNTPGLFNNSNTGTGGENIILFQRAGVTVGTISSTNALTSYNTSSDYRLKEDYKEINGLDKVSKIKVYDFKWKNSEDRMDGVIAHELAEVIPYAVQGEKDGEQMQQVDYSKLVPILVKSIQELESRIKQLENK